MGSHVFRARKKRDRQVAAKKFAALPRISLHALLTVTLIMVMSARLVAGNGGDQWPADLKSERGPFNMLEYYPMSPADSYLRMDMSGDMATIRMDGISFWPPDKNGIIKRFTKTELCECWDYLKIRPSGIYIAETKKALLAGKGTLFLPAKASLEDKWDTRLHGQKYVGRLQGHSPEHLGQGGDFVTVDFVRRSRKGYDLVEIVLQKGAGPVSMRLATGKGHDGPHYYAMGLRDSFVRNLMSLWEQGWRETLRRLEKK